MTGQRYPTRVLGIEVNTPTLIVSLGFAALTGFVLRDMLFSTTSACTELALPADGPLTSNHRARNVVLTMAGGPNYEGKDGKQWAARFGGSFRRVNEDADVIFFTPGVHSDIEPLTRDLHMNPSIFNADPASDEPWSRMEVAARRWHLFRTFLEERASDYAGGSVLAIDARDSFFQRDPFRLMAGDDAPAVMAFLENGFTVGGSQWNADVIAACYDVKTVLSPESPVSRGTVSCSGTLLGTYEGMLEYLRAMEDEMTSPRANTATCMKAGGRDQVRLDDASLSLPRHLRDAIVQV